MKQAVVVIGNFDGVHLGHQALLTKAREVARARKMDLTIVTFEPHPRQYFQKDAAPFRLTPTPMKSALLKPLCDHYHALDFNESMVNMTADDFIQTILIDRCRAAIIMVGEDFHFGHGRSGTIDTLKARSEFETIPFDLFTVDGAPVSSSRIRGHLEKAEIKQASALLGRPWDIQSTVIHGDKRGRELGYPTANMQFGDTFVPAYGVYAVKIQIEGETEWHHGAANIGTRPMFESKVPLLETYIFDFDRDLYGQTLTIEPIQKIRDEMKFDNLDDLKAQMKNDCIVAKSILHKS